MLQSFWKLLKQIYFVTILSEAVLNLQLQNGAYHKLIVYVITHLFHYKLCYCHEY